MQLSGTDGEVQEKIKIYLQIELYPSVASAAVFFNSIPGICSTLTLWFRIFYNISVLRIFAGSVLPLYYRLCELQMNEC